MAFITTPGGDVYSTFRIGGGKAFENGFVILGTGADEVIEYVECPTDVAVAWRDHLGKLLMNHRPGRRVAQIDWFSIAAQIDEKWAREQERRPVEPEPVHPPTTQPVRLPADPHRAAAEGK